MSLFIPISFTRRMPTNNASYFAWLWLGLKLNFKDCSTMAPLGPSRHVPAPLPAWLIGPSNDRIHDEEIRILIGSGGRSTVKSAKTRALMDPHFSNDIPNYIQIVRITISSSKPQYLVSIEFV